MHRGLVLAGVILVGLLASFTVDAQTLSIAGTRISATNISLALNTSATAVNCSVAFNSLNSTTDSITLNIPTAALTSPLSTNTTAANYTFSFDPSRSLFAYPSWIGSASPWIFLQNDVYNISAVCYSAAAKLIQSNIATLTQTGAVCLNTTTFDITQGCTTCATGWSLLSDNTTCGACATGYFGTLCAYHCIHGSLNPTGDGCNCFGNYKGIMCNVADTVSLTGSPEGGLIITHITVTGFIFGVLILTAIGGACTHDKVGLVNTGGRPKTGCKGCAKPHGGYAHTCEVCKACNGGPKPHTCLRSKNTTTETTYSDEDESGSESDQD